MKKINKQVKKDKEKKSFNLIQFFEKTFITPLSKLMVILKNFFKNVAEKTDELWSRKSSALVFSLICAILLFIAVDKKFIVLSDSNAAVLANQKVKAIYNEEDYVIEGLPKTVDVTLIGKKGDVSLAKQYPEKEVTVDLQKLKPGMHKVKLKYEQKIGSVKYIVSPSEVTINVYNKISEKRDLTVDILNKDKLDSRLNIEDVQLNVDTVIIKGKAKRLEEVASVKALIDAEKLSHQGKSGTVTVTDIPLVAYDAKGKPIDVEIVSEKLEGNIKLISPAKTIPIKIITTGNLGDKAIKSITPNIREVKVFGDSDALEDLEYLPVKIDVTGIDENKVNTVNLGMPKGVTDLSVKTIKVEIRVDKLESKEIKDVTVRYDNIADGLKVQAADKDSSEITVIVKGTKDSIKDIDKASIYATVDLTGKGVGKHEVEIEIHGDDPRLVFTSKVKKIQVIISKE